MAGHSLLQVLLVAIIAGTAIAQVNTRNFYAEPVRFPQDQREPGTVNRFVASGPLPQTPPVRARQRPACSMLTGDGSAPCVEDRDYNDNIKNLVTRYLRQSNSINEIVNDPMLKIILNDTLTPTPSDITPSTRFGGFRETPVCVSTEELIFPQRAKTPKDDWVFVVNQDDLKQALRVEKCIREGEPCNIDTVSSRDVTTICRQKYVYRRMLAVGSNRVLPEEVLMPSCCVCYSRRNNFDIGTRVGANENGTNPEGRTPASGAPIQFNPAVTSSAVRQPAPQPQHNRPIRNQQNPFHNMYYQMGGRR